MANDADFIIGLMRDNYEAVGFIPATTVEQRYIKDNQYAIQRNRNGAAVGYLLHGKPTPGGVLTVAQACIEYDQRDKGHGQSIVRDVVERAELVRCRAITLRCAEDLDANAFWQAMGFEHTSTLHVANRRQRAIHVYTLDLWPTLWVASA